MERQEFIVSLTIISFFSSFLPPSLPSFLTLQMLLEFPDLANNNNSKKQPKISERSRALG